MMPHIKEKYMQSQNKSNLATLTKVFITILISIFTTSFAFGAGEGSETGKIVEISGVGDSLLAAKEDSIRQAVESVVSSYVSSDLIQKNENVIRDKVINYSAGFVEKIDVLSQRKRPDGLFEVKIRAQVTTQKLRRKLEENNIKTRELESDSMFGEAVSKLNTVNSAGDLWGNLLKKFPAAALEAKVVGKPQIEPSTRNEDNVIIRLNVQVNWNEEYVGEFYSLLSKTATKTRQFDETCFGFTVDDVCFTFHDKIMNRKIFSTVHKHITPIRLIAKIKSSDNSIVNSIATECIGSAASSRMSRPLGDMEYAINFPANPFIFTNYSGLKAPRELAEFIFLFDPKKTSRHLKGRGGYVEKMYSQRVSFEPVGTFSMNIGTEVNKKDILKFKTVDVSVESCQF